jgi:NAD(P)-dependent dehydrogenase (short-subunit alcohol dehydrogenase family)
MSGASGASGTSGSLATFSPTALAGKTALVTGGGTGMGAEIAAGYAALGARLPVGRIGRMEEIVAAAVFLASDAAAFITGGDPGGGRRPLLERLRPAMN